MHFYVPVYPCRSPITPSKEPSLDFRKALLQAASQLRKSLVQAEATADEACSFFWSCRFSVQGLYRFGFRVSGLGLRVLSTGVIHGLGLGFQILV